MFSSGTTAIDATPSTIGVVNNAASNTFNIINVGSLSAGSNNGVTFASGTGTTPDRLIIGTGNDGTYLINYSMSMTTSNTARDTQVGVFINNIVLNDSLSRIRTFAGATNAIAVSKGFLAGLTGGDTVDVRIKFDDTGAVVFTWSILHFNLSLFF
jgi:hypothetical protein